MTNNDNLEVSLFIATSTQSEALALSLAEMAGKGGVKSK